MRRLLLVVNANAQTVTRSMRRVIAQALAASFEVEEVETERRGHAEELARAAVPRGVDVVVAFGGDGTVNEAANGLAGSDLPLAVLPGGGTNVFARALGIPREPVEAGGWLLARLARPPRRIPLGRVDERYFTCNCGVGLDAAIVRRVERRQLAKHAVGEAFYVWSGLRARRELARRPARLRVSWGDDLESSRDDLAFAIVQNLDPFTFLGDRPLRVCPDARLENGLDCLAMDTVRLVPVVRAALRTLAGGPRGRHVVRVEGQQRLLVEADHPMPVQADGEFVGERDRVAIELAPEALAVYA